MSKDNSSASATNSGSANKKRPTGDYDVGYCRPPVHTQYKKGESGNPKGRTKGRRNVKTELKEIVNKRFKVREGETEHKLSLLGANVLAHGVKGAKGDVRSASLFLSNAQKLGLLEDEEASSAPVGASLNLIGIRGGGEIGFVSTIPRSHSSTTSPAAVAGRCRSRRSPVSERTSSWSMTRTTLRMSNRTSCVRLRSGSGMKCYRRG